MRWLNAERAEHAEKFSGISSLRGLCVEPLFSRTALPSQSNRIPQRHADRDAHADERHDRRGEIRIEHHRNSCGDMRKEVLLSIVLVWDAQYVGLDGSEIEK